MKSGFSLIEIVVALALASLLTIVLYTSFEQTKRTTKRMESLEEVSALTMRLYYQLEKDLGGVFVPPSFLVQDKKVTTTSGQPVPEKQEQEKESEKLPEVFRVQIKGEEKEFTFITTNPLLTYQEIKPRLVRVMYRIIPSKTREGTFAFTRRESTEIDLKKFLERGDENVFTIMDEITKITFRFMVLDPEQKEEKKELVSWDIAAQKEMKNLIPNYVIFEGTFEDLVTHKEHPFNFSFALPAAAASQRPEKKKPDQSMRPEGGPAPGGKK
ncbi:MAG: prepilin-type N-terminal cleavage/methylation domain-containing protein [Candidatus Babeliaceae bacterium]